MIRMLKYWQFEDSTGTLLFLLDSLCRFLLDEVARLQEDTSYESCWLQRTHGQGQDTAPFALRASGISLFISGTPCGDASLDLLAEQPEYAVPWTARTEDESRGHYRGHEYIWETGKVSLTWRS